MELGPHAAFILAAYAAVAAVLAGLIAWLVHDGQRYQRQLDALERQGVRRRSAESGAGERGA